MHKVLKCFGQEGGGALKNEMEQIYRQTSFDPISIK